MFLVHLTVEERDILLAHVDPPDALDEVFRAARVAGALVSLELNRDQLDEFDQCLEQAVVGAQNILAQERLGRAKERIDAGFADKVDAGWHMVRPAAATLGYSAIQGQYLAFIHTYTRLHRRAPAEAELQAYFRVSPPSVHEILKTLQRKGFIVRQPGKPRSIQLLLRAHEIPELE